MLYLFIFVVLIQLFYYFFFFLKFVIKKPLAKKTISELPISVIICAKNEAANLKRFLPFIINQHYLNFEIVLVNDHSRDATLEIMQSFQDKNKNITLVNINTNNSNGNKKNAITQGIKAAKFDHLLFTDADCKPNSNLWISAMSSNFSIQKKILLGYGAYEKINTSWLNKLIRFETLSTAIQYFSYALNGMTYMGVGRNLGYIKATFQSVKGFDSHTHITSGDDDLFINQTASNQNVSCVFSSDSFTISKPHTNFKKWLYQKRRHVTTATSYKKRHQFLLSLFFITQFLFWFLFLFFLIGNYPFKIIGILFMLRLIIQYVLIGLSAKKLNEKDLIPFIPFLELFLILVHLRIFITNLIHKPTKWS